MRDKNRQKTWLRGLVEFALDEDVNREIDEQRRTLKDRPQSAKAHFDLAVLHYSQRRIPESISEFQSAIACDPNYACAHRKLGEVYINTGDYERAGQCALKAAE